MSHSHTGRIPGFRQSSRFMTRLNRIQAVRWTFQQHKALPSCLDDQSPGHFFEWQLGWGVRGKRTYHGFTYLSNTTTDAFLVLYISVGWRNSTSNILKLNGDSSVVWDVCLQWNWPACMFLWFHRIGNAGNQCVYCCKTSITIAIPQDIAALFDCDGPPKSMAIYFLRAVLGRESWFLLLRAFSAAIYLYWWEKCCFKATPSLVHCESSQL